jgi:glutaminyl-peptide cyclotransferase
MKNVVALLALSIIFLFSCNNEVKEDTSLKPEAVKPLVNIPDFNADNAYQYIEKQVSFGPRVPGSTSQKKCASWLEQELKKYADTVYIQKANVKQSISNKTYPAINIIASFNLQATDRILLLAHWDSRPWADEDTKDVSKPIDAADDGASGVAVLLEIASKLKSQKPTQGIDILLVDAEDVGKTEWSEQSYCLGTQHWAQNPHVSGYRAKFGICLDMVGAKGAQFPLEGFSKSYAGDVQTKVWDIANRIGYSDYFRYVQGGTITDDHLVVNEIAKIPCIDIINLQANGGFGTHWHTHNDNINVIDKATLKAVGQTLMHVVYE